MSPKKKSRKKIKTSQVRSRRSSSSKAKPPNETRLVPLDQKPFLKKALANCRRLRTELRKKQERLQKFEEVELTEYDQWMYRRFGQQISEAREAHKELEELEFIAEQLRLCEIYQPDNVLAVHEELIQRKKDGTVFGFTPPKAKSNGSGEESSEKSGDDDEFDAFSEDEEEKEFWDLLGEEFEKMFGHLFDEEDDEFDDKDPSFNTHQKDKRAKEAPSKEEAQLKQLYRQLAKRLHPDRSAMEEGMRERRWHELQKAYHEWDLNSLQRIEAVCDMDETGLTIRLGLARLNDLADYHQAHLRPLRQAIKEAKQHPAFNFDENKCQRNEKQIERSFEETFDSVDFYCMKLHQEIASIYEAAKRKEKVEESEKIMKDAMDKNDREKAARQKKTKSSKQPKQAKKQKSPPDQMEFL